MISWEKYGFYPDRNKLTFREKARAWAYALTIVLGILLVGYFYFHQGYKEGYRKGAEIRQLNLKQYERQDNRNK